MSAHQPDQPKRPRGRPRTHPRPETPPTAHSRSSVAPARPQGYDRALSPNAQRALVLLREGKSRTEIAAALGAQRGRPVSRQRVQQLLRRGGMLVPKRPDLALLDTTIDAARNRSGVTRNHLARTVQWMLAGEGYRIGLMPIMERMQERWGQHRMVPPFGVPDHFVHCSHKKHWVDPSTLHGHICRDCNRDRMRIYQQERARAEGKRTFAEFTAQRAAQWARRRQDVLALVEQHGVERVAILLGRTPTTIRLTVERARREREGGAL